LNLAARSRAPAAPADTIADLVGSVDGLPMDLSRRKKAYLRTTGYGPRVLVDAGFVIALLSRRDRHHK